MKKNNRYAYGKKTEELRKVFKWLVIIFGGISFLFFCASAVFNNINLLGIAGGSFCAMILVLILHTIYLRDDEMDLEKELKKVKKKLNKIERRL